MEINGVGFTFPQGASIPANGFAIVSPITPASFRAKYNVPAAVPIFGPYNGNLQDDGEKITLQRPDVPIVGPPASVPYVDVDEVKYSDRAPWPVGPAGSGPSLQRTTASAFGNDPANWFASGNTPGLNNDFNAAPAVSIVSPTSGSSYTLPTNVLIQVSAADTDGTVSKVEFLDGGTKLGEAITAPYTFTWTESFAWDSCPHRSGDGQSPGG